MKHDLLTAAICALSTGVAAAAHAQSFFDDFNDGVLDGWTGPTAYGPDITGAAANIAGGQLVLSAQNASDSSGLYINLISSLGAPTYLNGSASFDVYSSDFNVPGIVIRQDGEDWGYGIGLLNAPGAANDQVFITTTAGGVLTNVDSVLLGFSADAVQLQLSWFDDQLSVTAMQIGGVGQTVLDYTDDFLATTFGVGLILESSPLSGPIEARFDNFFIVPAPGTAAVLLLGACGGFGRRCRG